MMKHLAHFALSKSPSGTSIESIQAVGRDSQTVPLSNKLRTLPVRTCMSQRMKRERRGARFLFELAPLTSCNFEAFPEAKSVYVWYQVGLQFRTPDSQ